MLESPIQPGDSCAELLQEMAVFIWDEVPMANRAAVACAHDALVKLTGNPAPFGGKVALLVGDFRQTGPMIRNGTRAQIVDASICLSPLWPAITIRHLTIPIRNAEDPTFAQYVDAIGNGAGPEVPIHPYLATVMLASDMVDFVFPEPIRHDPESAVKRVILAPTNQQVDNYNSMILDLLDGEAKPFLLRTQSRTWTR
jgi:ATP-dependent DNA helicase PIF1